jgi:hypothetical protein
MAIGIKFEDGKTEQVFPGPIGKHDHGWLGLRLFEKNIKTFSDAFRPSQRIEGSQKFPQMLFLHRA